MSYSDRREVSALVGKTLVEIIGMTVDSDEVVFVCADGERFKMSHYQDCCEHVRLVDVIGSPLPDLLGSPLVLAEESTSDQDPEDSTLKGCDDSFTWTFYRFATAKGHVDLRWLGESNGYYSEGVDFEKVTA